MNVKIYFGKKVYFDRFSQHIDEKVLLILTYLY